MENKLSDTKAIDPLLFIEVELGVESLQNGGNLCLHFFFSYFISGYFKKILINRYKHMFLGNVHPHHFDVYQILIKTELFH